MRLARWHRRLALWLALPVLAWSLTGLLHPLMSRWQPSAAERQPPATMLAAPAGLSWSDYPAPARVLPGELRLRELRALTWQGRGYWLLQRPSGGISYVDARDGRPVDIERELVITLARHYTGERQAAVSLSRVTGFSDEYPAVNRYLPVWRVAFDRPDGLVAFIEPRGLLLAGLTDTWKTRFTGLFGNLHSWKWLGSEPVRDAAMTLVLVSIVVLVLSGLLRARQAGGRRPVLRRCASRRRPISRQAPACRWWRRRRDRSGMTSASAGRSRPGTCITPLAASMPGMARAARRSPCWSATSPRVTGRC